MNMSAIKYVSLQVNCGYARTAMFECVPTLRGCNARKGIEKEETISKFKTIFQSNPTYGIPDGYFDSTEKHESPFVFACNKILNGFKKKWKEKSIT